MADDQFDSPEHRDLASRLQRLGAAPIDPIVAQRHLTAMVAVPERRGRFSRKAVALAAVVGFLAGSTGLAAAGALPGPAQDVAHDVFGAVGIGVPRSTEDCPEGRTYANHGAYVSEVEAAGGDVRAAAKSNCGKPVKGAKGNAREQGKSGDGGKSGTAPGARPDRDGDPCTGPPPWAGAGLPKEERAALQEQRRATCGDDVDADEPEAEVETQSGEGEGGDDTTTTTATTETTETTETTATTAPSDTSETTETTGG